MNTAGPAPSGSGSKPPDQPLNRACEACRGLKVRCLPDNDSTSAKCARCAKSGRPCHYATPQKRRQRKRTDTRVAELEREVRAMRSLLGKESRGAKSHETPGSDDYDIGGDDADASSDEGISTNNLDPISDHWNYVDTVNPFASSRSNDESGQKQGSKSPPGMLPDVIDRGFLSLSKATELYNLFVKKLIWHTPIIGLPEDVTMGEMRSKKPVLFLSIITGAAGTVNHPLYTRLHAEMLRVYADRVIIMGEKTLELVQSMLITAIWHFPPEDFKELKFYQYIHLAATMALDIGLGSRRVVPTSNNETVRDAMEINSKVHIAGAITSLLPEANDSRESFRRVLPEPILERQRTFLGCYILCASVSITLRRPNMLRFTAWLADCLESVEHSPLALPTDPLLVAWVKMQRITDEYAACFSYDDPSAVIGLSDQRILLTLKTFDSRLEEWRRQTPPGVINGALTMNFHQNKIFIAEFGLMGLHEELNSVQAAGKSRSSENAQPLSTAYISALVAAVDAAQTLLDSFLSMEPELIRNGPVITYVRVCYAVVLAIKIAVAASSPSSELGKHLDIESLKIDRNIKSLINHLNLVSDSKKYRIPTKFTYVLHKLSIWYQKIHASRIPRMDQGQQQLVTSLVGLAVESDRTEGTASSHSIPHLTPTSPVGSNPKSSPHHNHIPDTMPDYNGNVNPQHFMDGSSSMVDERGLYNGGVDMTQSGNVAYPYNGQMFLPMDMDLELFGLYSGLPTETNNFNGWIPDPSLGFASVPQGDWNGSFN